MSVIGLKSLFSIDDVVSSEMAGPNTIMVHTGDSRDSSTLGAAGHEAEWWQTVGLASRPGNVSGSGKNANSCQAVSIVRSDYNIVIASRDTRTQSIYGALKAGETCLYAAGSDGRSQARILLKNNGSINLFTKKGNVDSGLSMGIFIDPIEDSISLLNSKGYGLVIKDETVYIIGKTINLSGTNVSIVANGGSCHLDGGTVLLGSAATPATAAICGVTGLTGIPSTKVFVSPA